MGAISSSVAGVHPAGVSAGSVTGAASVDVGAVSLDGAVVLTLEDVDDGSGVVVSPLEHPASATAAHAATATNCRLIAEPLPRPWSLDATSRDRRVPPATVGEEVQHSPK